MLIGKKYMCEDVNGNVKILEAAISRDGDVCFTDGNEYFYLDGCGEYGDEIVRYHPYGWDKSVAPKVLGWTMFTILVFYFGVILGKLM